MTKQQKSLINWDKLTNSELPIITVNHNNIQFKLLVDTGCENSLIDENIIELLIAHQVPSNIEGIVYGNGEESDDTEAYMMDLYLGEDMYKVTFQAVDLSKLCKEFKDTYGVRIRGTLGSDFLSKYGYAVDYSNKNIHRIDGKIRQTKLNFESPELSETTES